jgi:predicted glycosyltransferase
MTAEACLLGKPTISIAPVPFYVEKYLISSGLLQRANSPEHLVLLTKKMVTDDYYTEKQKKKAKRVLENMDDPVDKLFSFVSRSE